MIRIKHTFTISKFSDVTENRPLICTRLAFDLSSRESLNPVKSRKNGNYSSRALTKLSVGHIIARSIPPELFIGADKLFAEARVGNIKGPLKLGALRTSR